MFTGGIQRGGRAIGGDDRKSVVRIIGSFDIYAFNKPIKHRNVYFYTPAKILFALSECEF